MAVVTVTSPVGTTCHYVFTPQSIENTTGLGIESADIVRGWTNVDAFGVPSSLSVDLDNTFLWDVNISFRLAPPIVFEGFAPGDGGDLLTLLTAQGWTAL